MFHRFFLTLREAKVPVSLREYLTLLEGLERDVVGRDVDDFYRFARAALVKDERHLDRFDQVFAHVFRGVEDLGFALDEAEIPDEWLRAMAEKILSPEERADIEAMGGLDALMEALRERLREQHKRHEGGSRMIGTGGTSPFGGFGDNPAGVRMGQAEGRRGRAAKVWERRLFKDLDGDRTLDVRGMQMALRRLRKFAREGAAEELDLDATVADTAREGWLQVRMRPERRNAVKVLLMLDVGGSMDPWADLCERLFSAARLEFKRLDHVYFHNCLYERVWRDNARRFSEATPTWDLLHSTPSDTCIVIVGDAAMAPWEITHPGGSVEHINDEAGAVWLQRLADLYPRLAWLNPTPEDEWGYTASIQVVRNIIGAEAMVPLTLEGVDRAMTRLTAIR